MIFRKATATDLPAVWTILQQAIERRRLDGSDQWQNGYPNEGVVQSDMANGYAYVLEDGEIVAYAAVIFDEEPAYNTIEGQWLSSGNYTVVHRVATSDAALGKGVATQLFREIESLCLARKVPSIRVDTNFDNLAMLRVFEKLDYTYCGEVLLHGAPRKAFEKLLTGASNVG